MAVAVPAEWLAGDTGASLDLAGAVARLGEADFVAFGELHGHPEGARAELALLTALADGPRPVTLAMEFFERDVQPALDAYLAGKTTEEEFLKVARQGPAYPKTHRPLIEACKARGIPVVAANAPRRLVSARRAAKGTYAEWRASLSEADRGWVPTEATEPDEAYRKRFVEAMGEERGARLFVSQAMWDDAMGEAVARARTEHPERRVLLVVGAFHVQGRLGTASAFSKRRPQDVVRVVAMTTREPGKPAFTPDLKGEGDLLLVVAPAAAAVPPAPAAERPR
jgi:uncharacterized iron-regulated protein